MSIQQKRLDDLRRAAEIHVDLAKKSFKYHFDYSEESVAFLDQMIDELWGEEQPVMVEAMVHVFGAYLGEVIVRRLHGAWVENEEGDIQIELHLADGSKMIANVFSKTLKRFNNGMEDSLGYYYQGLKRLLQEGLPGLRSDHE